MGTVAVAVQTAAAYRLGPEQMGARTDGTCQRADRSDRLPLHYASAWLTALDSQSDTRRISRPAIVRYGVAVLSIAAALASALLLQRYLQTEPFASSLLCAIMFAAWFGGAGADLLAVALEIGRASCRERV